MRYLYGEDALVAGFVARMIPHVGARGFGKCRAIGIVNKDSELIAGVVFHDMSTAARIIGVSAAALPGRQWVSRDTLRLFTYPFIDCDCQMIINQVPADDERQLRMLAALGYQFVTVPRWFGRDRDGVLALLTYEDWLDNKICQRPFKTVPAERTDDDEQHLRSGRSNAAAGFAQHDYAGAHEPGQPAAGATG